jgi:hypothetical protein
MLMPNVSVNVLRALVIGMLISPIGLEGRAPRSVRNASIELPASIQSASAPAPGATQVNLDIIGPRVGTRVPDFSGVDQLGRSQSLQSVLGSEGAMLVFFRSADW